MSSSPKKQFVASPHKRPNILYIHSHDTGRHIQPYGHAVHTPNLQRLAEEGVLFRQNFCINPTCSPSRASLLTGTYPFECGMMGLAHLGWSLNDYGQHIVHALRVAGYVSVLAGEQHVATDTDEKAAWEVIGYDRQLEGEGHTAAAAFLKDAPEQPFFLAVGFFETHREFPPLTEAPDNPAYCLPPAPLPDTPETRVDMARFKASARILDEKMGMVFDALEQSGLAGNTLVICTTDHGIAFPRMKCNLQDSGTGTMLILRGPGGFDGGKVVDGMTSHLDIFPTVCEMVGVEAPSRLRGRSLCPLVNGKVEELHDALFFEVNYHAAYEPMRAVRTKRWKYIRRFHNYPHPVFPNCNDGESKSVWLDYDWGELRQPREALYDLVFDPNEVENRVDDPELQLVLKELRNRMGEWMEETDDPLLDGPVHAPAGAKVLPVAALSHRVEEAERTSSE
jgi:N-sulfoglucosamine sulfohydrolase